MRSLSFACAVGLAWVVTAAVADKVRGAGRRARMWGGPRAATLGAGARGHWCARRWLMSGMRVAGHAARALPPAAP